MTNLHHVPPSGQAAARAAVEALRAEEAQRARVMREGRTMLLAMMTQVCVTVYMCVCVCVCVTLCVCVCARAHAGHDDTGGCIVQGC